MARQFGDSIRLNITGGGVLDVHGLLAAKTFFLILGRDDFTKEDPFTQRLMSHLTERGQTVLWYESGAKNTRRLLNTIVPSTLPKAVRWFIKGCWLFVHPRHWSYAWRSTESIPFRCESLVALLEFLGPQCDKILLTRSGNGRVASRVADAAGIQKIVCLGYPFQQPGHPVEPTRFDHLSMLKTPMLIVQGVDDPYGGREILDRYALSPQITVRLVETDHDFRVGESLQAEVLREIDAFIFPRSGVASSECVLF